MEQSLLAAWPVEVPLNWVERVNQADDGRELEALRRSVQRGRPYGRPESQKDIAGQKEQKETGSGPVLAK